MGLGAGLIAFLPCNVRKEIDVVIEATRLEEHIKNASLVITGEGKIDSQTIYGKTPIGVAKLVKKYKLPVIGIGGSLGSNYQVVYEYGIDALFSVVQGVTTLDDALHNGYENVYQTARNIAEVFKINCSNHW